MRNAILMFLLTLLGTQANAKENGEGTDYWGFNSPEYTLSGGVMSMYRLGNGLIPSAYPAGWGDFAVAFENGFSFDVWGVANSQADGDEIDYSVSWFGRLDGIQIGATLQYYDIGKLGRLKGGDIITGAVTLSKELWTQGPHSLSGAVKLQGQLFTKGTWYDEVKPSLTYAYQLTPKISVNATTAIALIDQLSGTGDGVLARERFGASVEIAPHLTVQPYVEVFARVSGLPGRRDESTVYGVDFSLSFKGL